jgi:hypothetical protein
MRVRIRRYEIIHWQIEHEYLNHLAGEHAHVADSKYTTLHHVWFAIVAEESAPKTQGTNGLELVCSLASAALEFQESPLSKESSTGSNTCHKCGGGKRYGKL